MQLQIAKSNPECPKRAPDAPKTFQTLANSTPNPPKTHPKPSQIDHATRFVLQMGPKSVFFNFLAIFGAPGASQNRAKIAKNRKKAMKNRCRKNTRFSTPFFSDFSWFWPPKTIPKSSFFRYFFENADFVKIVVFLKENCYFSGFGPRKIDEKSCAKIYLFLTWIF